MVFCFVFVLLVFVFVVCFVLIRYFGFFVLFWELAWVVVVVFELSVGWEIRAAVDEVGMLVGSFFKLYKDKVGLVVY